MEISEKIGEATTIAYNKTKNERAHSTEVFEQSTAHANPNTLEKILESEKNKLDNDNKNGINEIANESYNTMGVNITI